MTSTIGEPRMRTCAYLSVGRTTHGTDQSCGVPQGEVTAHVRIRRQSPPRRRRHPHPGHLRLAARLSPSRSADLLAADVLAFAGGGRLLDLVEQAVVAHGVGEVGDGAGALGEV